MPSNLIPNGYRTPPWMQTLHYTLDPLQYMDKAAQRCGEIFNAPVIGNHKQVLFVSNPDAIKQIFTNDTKQLFAPSNLLLQPLVGDRSIFGMEGDRHRRERRLLMPPFHREHIPRYGELIIDLTQKALGTLSPEHPFVARELMQDISLEVILKVVFGMRDGQRFEQLKSLIIELTDLFQAPLFAIALFQPTFQKDLGPRSPWGKFCAVKRQMRDVLYAEIRDRRQRDAADAVDILSLLIQARDDQGNAMTDAELHDELFTLLLAGHETTAIAVSWALYWIHRDRQVYETLRSELNTLGPQTDAMTIAQLPYLTAVCQEALRIYPVAFITVPREVLEPITLMGYELQPKTRLYAAIYLLHHNPELYPNPSQFIPDRFLERQYSSFEFIPFGGGARRCIGEILAQFEMKLILATMLRHHEFRLADTQPEIPKRRGVTLAPKRGVRMQMRS